MRSLLPSSARRLLVSQGIFIHVFPDEFINVHAKHVHTDSERALSTKDASSKAKEVTVCLSGSRFFLVNGPLAPEDFPPVNDASSFVANFISEVFNCADVNVSFWCSSINNKNRMFTGFSLIDARVRVQPSTAVPPNDAPKAGASKLGDVAWTCSWVQPANAAAPSNLKRAPCTGVITLTSDWHKTTPLSTAAFSFWADTIQIRGGQISSPIAPAVTATTGAWPKPDTVTGFNWAIVSGVQNTD